MVDRIEEIVVALVLLVEARLGERGTDKEEIGEQPNYPHREPPSEQTPSVGSLLFSTIRHNGEKDSLYIFFLPVSFLPFHDHLPLTTAFRHRNS